MASDNLSVGINYAVSEDDTDTTLPDEKTKMISLGYNLGGLGLELSYAEVEDAANAEGDDALPGSPAVKTNSVVSIR